jgi:hypothetical protein
MEFKDVMAGAVARVSRIEFSPPARARSRQEFGQCRARAVPEKMYPAGSGCATARNSDARLSRVSRPLGGEGAARIGAPRSFAARAEARLFRMTIVRIQPLWNRSSFGVSRPAGQRCQSRGRCPSAAQYG